MNKAFGEGVEVVQMGQLHIEIDHSIPFARNIYYGIYEEHLVNWIRRNLKPGDTVIEPGTNMGYIASQILDAITPGGRLICLEPSTRCYNTLLRHNPSASSHGMQLLHAALSNTDGTESFCETPRILSAGYGFLDSAWQPPDVGNKYPVKTYSVDRLVDEFEIERVRFLKLDVEGSELNALRGASRTLGAGKIDAIMVETGIDLDNPVEVERNSAIWPILFDAGFCPHRMTRAGRLVPIQIPPRTTKAFRQDILWQR